MDFLLLVFLGAITYFIVKRSVTGITRTPVWLLWLVMMTPALLWTGWTLLYGEETSPPLVLFLGPFVICPFLYWWLIQLGRRGMSPPAAKSGEQQRSSQKSAQQSPLRPINQAEETQLQGCFPWSVYYLQQIEYRPQAAICRGQLRTTPEAAYQTIRENIEAKFGDRFLIVFQEGINDKPFFTLFLNPHAQQQAASRKTESATKPGLALGLLVATLCTTTYVGTFGIAGVSNEPFPTNLAALFSNPGLLLLGLPYALALMTILGIHELGHYLTAQFYRIRATLPYFIPVPFFLGTFGAFIQIRSPVPNRKALFDVGIAGPLAGLVVTLPFLMWGLAHSQVIPLSDDSGVFNFQSLDPKATLLLALLSKLALGNALNADSAIQLHPVAVAGCLGLIVTALNLMPVGQLDGGHVVHAMVGQRAAMTIGQLSRIFVLILAWTRQEFLIWAIFLLFMPVYDEPALNDVSELDNWRDFWGLLALGLLLAIILPAPGAITQLLF